MMVEPTGEHATTLWLGSGVRKPERLVVRVLVPLHRWYSRRLLAGAAGRLSGG